jgi:hypothetical protein
MKKMSLDVFEQGLHQGDSDTREVCRRALLLMGKMTEKKSFPPSVRSARTGSQKPAVGKLEIKEIPPKGRSKRRIGTQQPRQRRLAKNEDSS